MALKIRLRQQGRTNCATYRVVLADTRSPRDGKYIELLGWYNPHETEPEKSLSLNVDRIQHWLDLGAALSENLKTMVAKAAPSVIRREVEKSLKRKEMARQKRKARVKAA